jgi:hypothetical protein
MDINKHQHYNTRYTPLLLFPVILCFQFNMESLLSLAQRMIRMATHKPTCTHLNMDITRDLDVCHLCNKYPALGWMYLCQQDAFQNKAMNEAEKPRDPEDSDLTAELKNLGMSAATIRAAEQGHYTPEQLEILKEQKRKAIATFAEDVELDLILPEGIEWELELPEDADLKVCKTVPRATRCHLQCCHVGTALYLSSSPSR